MLCFAATIQQALDKLEELYENGAYADDIVIGHAKSTHYFGVI